MARGILGLLHHRADQQWPHPGGQPADQENSPRRPRISKLRQLLSAPPAAALRNHLAASNPDTTARPLTTFGCVEPLCVRRGCMKSDGVIRCPSDLLISSGTSNGEARIH